ncbi:TniQ family protein [Stenotrophomonas maltophilia]|uniref:TniQ family protein n=1 Tax=Stenotrophomonas maltophilia TaxID=40324 RepID=UPI003D18AD4A
MRIVWPPHVPDELLSSYLARIAIDYGISSHKLMALHAPGFQVWTRDVDVCASEALLERLTYPSGRSLQMLNGLTLGEWNAVTRRTCDPPQGVYHWINSMGVYHRTRLRHGLTFCPECLEENGAYLRQWRLSFWTVCPLHQRVLQDACPYCGAVVQPHRHGFDLRRCWYCNRFLTTSTTAAMRALPLQSFLFRCLMDPSNEVEFNGHCCSGAEVLWGSDVLLQSLKPVCRSMGMGPERGLRIELRRVPDRHADIELLSHLLGLGPAGLVAMGESMGVTQRCFRQQMPPWIKRLAEQLSAGRVNRGPISNRAELRSAGEAQRKRVSGWRGMRADVLFKMIGRSNEYR